MSGGSDMNSRSDRPESGGTEKDGLQHKADRQEADKEKLAQDMAAKRAGTPEHAHNQSHAPFSIGNEPNNAGGSKH